MRLAMRDRRSLRFRLVGSIAIVLLFHKGWASQACEEDQRCCDKSEKNAVQREGSHAWRLAQLYVVIEVASQTYNATCRK
jgi:hypothetical protein